MKTANIQDCIGGYYVEFWDEDANEKSVYVVDSTFKLTQLFWKLFPEENIKHVD